MHVFGTNATDLVHIGQAIMGCGGTVDYLVDTVFNYPTLSEAYKVAALDVTNKIRAVEAFEHRHDRRLEVPLSGANGTDGSSRRDGRPRRGRHGPRSGPAAGARSAGLTDR